MEPTDQKQDGQLEALVNERDALVRMQNVLTHEDWREMYLYFAEYASKFRSELEGARNWDEFVAARACKMFLETQLMHLPEIVKDSIDRLERDIAFEMNPAAVEVLDPPEYEED